MKVMDPELVAQLVDPSNATLSAGSNVNVEWRCPDNPRHVWSATPNTRKRSPRCPVCLNKVIIAGVNDLCTTDPQLAASLVDPATGRQVHRGSHTKVWWACATDPSHRWEASVVSRTRLKSSCPFCSGRVPVPGVNDLATTHPQLTSTLVDPGQATGVGPGSGKKLMWHCEADPNHVWSAPVRNRTGVGHSKLTGCPHCLGRTPHRKRPTLGEMRSPLIEDAVDPTLVATLTAGSGTIVRWRCNDCGEGHEYSMSVRKRVRGQGCPVKAGVHVLTGVNDLASTHPQLAAQLVDPSLATTVTRGSMTYTQWRCDQGHTWSTPVYARVAGNGCPHCCPVGSSYQEQEMLSALQALDVPVEHRAHLSRPDGKSIEVDALVAGVAFEFNGVFWHSEAAGRDRNSHASKWKILRELGISLVTVWEDDWADPIKRAVLVRTFAHKLRRDHRLAHALSGAGLAGSFDPLMTQHRGARTLRPGEIPGDASAAFFRHNHAQGAVALTRSFALFDEQDRPRAVLGLRSPAHNARANRGPGFWEIQRYATCGTIPGGFTRLLTYAERTLIDDNEPLTGWVTLSANEWSDGALYRASGFQHAGTTRPSYWYAGGPLRGSRKPKEAFQLRRFRSDPQLVYQEGWTEREAASANKLYRVWDCGKTRWTKAVTG